MVKMQDSKLTATTWTSTDEQAHLNSELEWWCIESFFTTNDTRNWCLKAVLSQSLDKSTGKKASVINITLFDLEKQRIIPFCSRDLSNHLETKGKRFSYQDSFIEGSYPDYRMHFKDGDHKIELSLSFHATAKPYWVAQEATKGWIPMGLGYYRYGFIPLGTISGNIKIQSDVYDITGRGYYEHVWGNFSYVTQNRRFRDLKKTFSLYSRLIQWFLHGRRITIPSSIIFATENSPFGNDWIWAVFENKWTLFYGNALFWMMRGPAFGSLILTKDGKYYTEFSEITFSYPKVCMAKHQDFVYPSEICLMAKKGNEQISLQCKMTTEPREWTNRIPKGKYWVSNTICEAPGVIEGFYNDGNETTNLRGICKIEPQRQVSILGHNSLTINILKPPNGVGFHLEIDSHFLRKNLAFEIRLTPRLKIHLRQQRKEPKIF